MGSSGAGLTAAVHVFYMGTNTLVHFLTCLHIYGAHDLILFFLIVQSLIIVQE